MRGRSPSRVWGPGTPASASLRASRRSAVPVQKGDAKCLSSWSDLSCVPSSQLFASYFSTGQAPGGSDTPLLSVAWTGSCSSGAGPAQPLWRGPSLDPPNPQISRVSGDCLVTHSISRDPLGNRTEALYGRGRPVGRSHQAPFGKLTQFLGEQVKCCLPLTAGDKCTGSPCQCTDRSGGQR